MPMCCRRVCAAHVHSPPESFRRQSRGTAFGKSTDVPASTETELWQMPQGRHIQHFLQRTLKRENKFKVQKMLHLFCKGVPFDFLHILFLPFPHTDNWKWQKSSVSKSAPMEKVANNSFRLGEGGGCGVCKSYCLCLSCFYAVKKLTGTYLYCWAKENSWFEAVKVFERPSLTHACPSWSAWSDAMSCYRNSHNSIPSPPEPWDLWELCLTSLLKCHVQRGATEMYPLGTGMRKAERFWGGGKTWSPLIISE